MMNTNSLQSLTHNVSDWAANTYQGAGKLAGKAFSAIQNIPQHMRADPKVAIGLFVIVNSVAFTVFHLAAQYINKNWIDNPGHEETDLKLLRPIQRILIDGLFVGGGLYAVNAGFAALTQYPVSRMILACITTAGVAFHALLIYLKNEKKEAPATPSSNQSQGQPQTQQNAVNTETQTPSTTTVVPDTTKQTDQQNPPSDANKDQQTVSKDNKSQTSKQDSQQTDSANQGKQENQNVDQGSKQTSGSDQKGNQTPPTDIKDSQQPPVNNGTPPTEGGDTKVNAGSTPESTPTVSFEEKVKQMVAEAQQKITNREKALTPKEKGEVQIILNAAVPSSMADAVKKQEAIDKRNTFVLANDRFEKAKAERQKRIDAKIEDEELQNAITNYETFKHEFRSTARKAIDIYPFEELRKATSTLEVDEIPSFELGEEAKAETGNN